MSSKAISQTMVNRAAKARKANKQKSVNIKISKNPIEVVRPRIMKAALRSMEVFQAMARNPPMNPRFPSGAAARGRLRTVICEDEYIGEVAGSTGFVATGYPVNPGQSATFPWLSKEAAQYEKYRFLGLEFYYKPEVSAFATNGQSGKVMLSFDSDASDPLPGTKQQVEDTSPHSDAMPYEECVLVIPQDLLRSFTDAFFVRPGGLPGGSDIKT
jgi:hypothetical protein